MVYTGPDLGLMVSQATVIVGPQPPHTLTISISLALILETLALAWPPLALITSLPIYFLCLHCYLINYVSRYRYFSAFFKNINLGWGPLSPGAPSTAFLASI